MFDDDGGLLLVDQPGCLGDELLGVEAELGEGAGRDALQDRGDGAADQLGLFRDLAEQVVLHLGACADCLGVGLGGLHGEASTAGQVVGLKLCALLPGLHHILQCGDVEVLVEVLDGFADQLA